MAYDKTAATANPPALACQRVGAAGGAIWIYKDGDSLDDVTGVNYISNATELGMKAGDKVVHIDTTDNVTNDLTVSSHHTVGTASGAVGDAIEAIGITSISLDSAGTGTVLIDDIVTFNNDPDGNEYRVTTGDTDISDGATIIITPGLVVATAVGTGMSIKTDVLNLASGKTGRSVHASSPAARLIQPSESGDLFLWDNAVGRIFTLPTAVVGLKYSFLCTVTATSSAHAVLTSTATAGDFMVGGVVMGVENAATGECFYADGTADLGFSQNGTTTGGLIGSYFEVEAITPVLWRVNGLISISAAGATPFTT